MVLDSNFSTQYMTFATLILIVNGFTSMNVYIYIAWRHVPFHVPEVYRSMKTGFLMANPIPNNRIAHILLN